MKNFLVLKTLTTPEIAFLTNGEFMITGSSRPENPHAFYNPLLEWLEKFLKTKPEKINLVMEVEYLNSSSVKILVQLLRTIIENADKNTQVSFTWKYDHEDLDSYDQGKGFEKITGFPIKIISK